MVYFVDDSCRNNNYSISYIYGENLKKQQNDDESGCITSTSYLQLFAVTLMRICVKTISPYTELSSRAVCFPNSLGSLI